MIGEQVTAVLSAEQYTPFNEVRSRIGAADNAAARELYTTLAALVESGTVHLTYGLGYRLASPAPVAPVVTGDTVCVTVTLTLTDQDVQDLVMTASSGVSYWAGDLTFEPEYRIVRFNEIHADGRDRLVDYNEIRYAFGLLSDPRQDLVSATIGGYFAAAIRGADTNGRPDLAQIDSDAGDALLQVAALGKLVYG